VAGQARRTSHIETPLEAPHPFNHDALSVQFSPQQLQPFLLSRSNSTVAAELSRFYAE